MARVTRFTEVPGPLSAAEALWYDLERRRVFFEGFAHVAKLEGPWPATGARVLWDGPPGGRGRVHEAVEAYEPRSGQTVRVEDEQLRGTQVTSFAAVGDGRVRVTVAFAWEPKAGNPLRDWVLTRRAWGEALRKSLVRYRIERLADVDDERAATG